MTAVASVPANAMGQPARSNRRPSRSGKTAAVSGTVISRASSTSLIADHLPERVDPERAVLVVEPDRQREADRRQADPDDNGGQDDHLRQRADIRPAVFEDRRTPADPVGRGNEKQ